MKAKKFVNRGLIAFLSVTLITLVLCVIYVNVEKSDLSEIASLCEERADGEDFDETSFLKYGFYKNEFRGMLYSGEYVIAEKKDGKWQIIKSFEEDYGYAGDDFWGDF